MDAFDELSDGQLLERTARDPEAFGAFYRRHATVVLAFHRRRTGDVQLALDLTAETFARALVGSASYREQAGTPPAAWLVTIARNLLADSYRRGRVRDDARRRIGLERLVVTDAGFERVEAACDAATALHAIDLEAELPAAQAHAVGARVIDGRSYDEIARELRCSRQVARQHVSRGLATLRRRLESQP